MQRPAAENTLAITFFYYKDPPTAMRFTDVLGLTLAIDQLVQDLPDCRGGRVVGR